MLNFGAASFGVTHRHLLSGRCRQGIVIGRLLGCIRDDDKGGVPGMTAVAAEIMNFLEYLYFTKNT